jgi:autotransporter-associated beta strand protein
VLDLNGTSQSVGAFSGTGGTVVNNGTGTNVTLTIGTANAPGGDFQGVIADHTSGTGTVALTKAGNSTVTLSGTNSYSGKTTVNGGVLLVGSGENIPNASVVEINSGAKLNVQAFAETIAGLASTVGDLNVVQNLETGSSGAGTLAIDTAGSDFTFTGIIRDNFGGTGTLALVKSGAGTQTLKCTNGLGPGTSMSFSGGATVNGGTLLLSGNGNGKVITSFASDVNLTAASSILAFENTGAVNNTQTFGKVISGSGNVVITAANVGVVALSQTNTYTGNTTVAAGTLSLAQPYLADGSTVSIASGAVLNLAHAGTDVVGTLVLGGVTQPDGIYDSSTPGGFITGTGKIQVGAVTGYASWASANAGGQGPDLDFDSDGVANGVEYFMNAPAGFTPNPGLVSGVITWTNGGNIAASAYGSQFVVQTSGDLATWLDVPVGNLTSNGSGPGGSLSFTLPSGEDEIFVRLRVAPN